MVFGGVDYIPTSFEEGHELSSGGSTNDQSEDIFNAYIGVSVKLNDCLTGTASYNYTNSNSDFADNDYDRNRFTLGISTEF
jgi:opacity protein-like surface antigen